MMEIGADKKRELFSQKMIDILNYGSLNLAMAIGYKTRLFDVMDDLPEPETAFQISTAAGLDNRYVVEWLGTMVSGGIIELSENSSGEDLFFLPKEYGDFLARRAGNSNLGVYTQEIPILINCVMDKVVDRFYSGDGVSYDNYREFQGFMSQLANAKHLEVLVDKFIPSVSDGELVAQLEAGIHVCDIGCAEGTVVMLMAEAFPNSEFIGIDISNETILKAENEVRTRNITNASFHHLDAALLANEPRFHERFDYITAFDSIHDQTQPLDALTGIYAMLKKGGLFSMVDIAASSSLSDNLDHPMGPFLYTVSLMHCMPVGLVDGGTGLGMMWGKQRAVDMMKKGGFDDVQVLEISDDPFNLHFLGKK